MDGTPAPGILSGAFFCTEQRSRKLLYRYGRSNSDQMGLPRSIFTLIIAVDPSSIEQVQYPRCNQPGAYDIANWTLIHL